MTLLQIEYILEGFSENHKEQEKALNKDGGSSSSGSKLTGMDAINRLKNGGGSI